MIGFNKPYLSGNEMLYMQQAVAMGKISGDGEFTRRCHRFFEGQYGFRKVLLTTSCTDALEMAALLTGIGPGDEVIMPSYTFVSTANAFVLRGAKIIFADSGAGNPNLDAAALEPLITPRTRVLVPVHYAGVACDMDAIMGLAGKYNLLVVEDAAQAIDGFYRGRPLGGIGHLAAFSFHETKNVTSGEGGMLVINDEQFIGRAEIIREKGTNRSAFFRGEVDKYGWVDVGSSDLNAAFLYAQLENLENIQARRRQIWEWYREGLTPLEAAGQLRLLHIPDFASNNAHMFYVVCRHGGEREGLINHLKGQGIQAVFHYLSLHTSPYYRDKHDGRPLPHSDHYSDCLVRLPLYYELTHEQVATVIAAVAGYCATLTPPAARSVKSEYGSL
jgi:dTDP-4-amino-4,6-dideoxygalactose transaminase